MLTEILLLMLCLGGLLHAVMLLMISRRLRQLHWRITTLSALVDRLRGQQQFKKGEWN